MGMELVVVLGSPRLNLLSRIGQVPKHMFVEAFVSKPGVEGLDESVFVWLTRRDEVVSYGGRFDPDSKRV